MASQPTKKVFRKSSRQDDLSGGRGGGDCAEVRRERRVAHKALRWGASIILFLELVHPFIKHTHKRAVNDWGGNTGAGLHDVDFDESISMVPQARTHPK